MEVAHDHSCDYLLLSSDLLIVDAIVIILNLIITKAKETN